VPGKKKKKIRESEKRLVERGDIAQDVRLRRSQIREHRIMVVLLGLIVSVAIFLMCIGPSSSSESTLISFSWASDSYANISDRVDPGVALVVAFGILALLTSMVIAIRTNSSDETGVHEVDEFVWRELFVVLSFIAPVASTVFVTFAWFGDLSGGDVSQALGATFACAVTVILSSVMYRDRSNVGRAVLYADTREKQKINKKKRKDLARLLDLGDPDSSPWSSWLRLSTYVFATSLILYYCSLAMAMTINSMIGSPLSWPPPIWWLKSLLVGLLLALFPLLSLRCLTRRLIARRPDRNRAARLWQWAWYQGGTLAELFWLLMLVSLSFYSTNLAQRAFTISLGVIPVLISLVPRYGLRIVKSSTGREESDEKSVEHHRVVGIAMVPIANLVARGLRDERRSLKRLIRAIVEEESGTTA
jgi:hypothetical protein